MKSKTLCRNRAGCDTCPEVIIEGNKAIITENFEGKTIKLAEVNL